MTTEIVIRGGSWYSSTDLCRSAYRFRNSPSYRDDNLGFRVVKEKKVEYRVLRGGSWISSAGSCRPAIRDWSGPSYRYYYYGFRVLKESKDDN